MVLGLDQYYLPQASFVGFAAMVSIQTEFRVIKKTMLQVDGSLLVDRICN